LTLDSKPNPDKPNTYDWDGKCVYDSMTDDCAMGIVEWPAKWPNPDAWMGLRVNALYNACKYNNKQFHWSIGGEADLTGFVNEGLVTTFVN